MYPEQYGGEEWKNKSADKMVFQTHTPQIILQFTDFSELIFPDPPPTLL